MTDWTFVDLAMLPKNSNRKKFECGIEQFNTFLWECSRNFGQNSQTKVYVAVYKEDDFIGGYYTLNTSRNPSKVIQIKKLAVDVRVVGMNVAELLLIHALEKIYKISSHCNDISAVEVISVWEDMNKFYKKFGFKSLIKDKEHMYLPLKTIEKLFSLKVE